jgi:hypothetical protein
VHDSDRNPLPNRCTLEMEVGGGRRGLERKNIFCMRIQMAYRQRLGRRCLWRRRKLTVHIRESRAAVTIQCAMRVYLAFKRVRRQRALIRYRNFLMVLRPGLSYEIDDLERYAAVKMQVAFRRRQAYRQAKKLRGARGYYLKMRSRYPLLMDDVPDHAATHVQCAWKSRQARRKRALLILEREKTKRIRGATRLQKVVRGRQARVKVQKERNTVKMRRLGVFFRDACFLKCWMNWLAFTDKAIHFKEVVGRTLKRWLSGGTVRSFNALRIYSKMKEESRQKAQKAAVMASKYRMGPRNRIWGYWADLLDDIRQIYTQVSTKCSSFLHLITGNFVKLAFSEWKGMMLKNFKAKKRRRNYRLFTTWKYWQTFLLDVKHFARISSTMASGWTTLTTRNSLFEFKDNVDDLRYNRSLISDAVFIWLNEALVRAFRSLDENAQMQIHYRKTVANFRRRFRLRGAMPMVRIWEDYASTKAEHKRIAKAAAFNLYRRAISGCLMIWVSVVHDKKLAEREMAAKNSHVLLRIVKRPMVICFEYWKDWYEEERKNRKIVHRISYRWRNANVVLCFRNWLYFVDSLVEERRETLRNAVCDAIKNGNLISLMQEAKRQKRRYLRGNLEDVMKDVLAEEDSHINHVVGSHSHALRQSGKRPTYPSTLRSHSFNSQTATRTDRIEKSSRHASPPKQHHPFVFDEFDRRNVPPQQQSDASAQAPNIERRKIKQILPSYLQGPQERKRGSAESRVLYDLFEPKEDNCRNSAAVEIKSESKASAIKIALDIPAPQFTWDGVPNLDVGNATAFPLMGFDAEMPTRSFEGVRESLSQFHAMAGKSKKKSSLFPAIRESRTAWPQIDERDDTAFGITGGFTDTKPDVKLPRVVPAPIAVPFIVDD